MMDAQQHLFGMMAIAEEQQKAVKAAIDGLAAEWAAVAKERASMAQVLLAVNNAAQGVRKAAGEAIATSVAESLSGASKAAAEALDEASKPVIDRLSGVVKAASNAEGRLNGAVAAFGWQWAMVAGSTAAGAIAAVLLAAWISVGWQRHQVESLSAEVAELKATAADLAKRGARAEFTACGDKKRPCVRVDNVKEGYGNGRDYFVLKGY